MLTGTPAASSLLHHDNGARPGRRGRALYVLLAALDESHGAHVAGQDLENLLERIVGGFEITLVEKIESLLVDFPSLLLFFGQVAMVLHSGEDLTQGS
jgi:hypothetical protein